MFRMRAGKGTTDTHHRRPLVFFAVLVVTAFVALVGGLAARAVVLEVATYTGTADADWTFDLAIDDQGRPVVVSLAWDLTGDAGGGDIVIARYSADGKRLETFTRIGGAGLDYPTGVAVAPGGHIVVTGSTRSTDFPRVKPIQDTHSGGEDGFLLILDTDATTILASTYLGGSGDDRLEAVAVDEAGNIHVVGHTTSHDLRLVNAMQPLHAGGRTDGLVLGLEPDATALTYASYLGGHGEDGITALTILDHGEIALAGHSNSPDLPFVDPLPTAGRNLDAWISVLDTTPARDGRPPRLAFATRVGGSGDDAASAVARDGQGRLLIAGRTLVRDGYVTDFPTINALQSTAGGGDSDGFLVRLAADRTAIETSTYLGGDGDDSVDAMAVDEGGRVHIGVTTRSRTGLRLRNAQQPVLAGGADVYYARLESDLTAIGEATYLGGGDNDRLRAITLDPQGKPWLAGLTASPRFPTRNAERLSLEGLLDGFLVRLGAAPDGDSPPVVTPPPDLTVEATATETPVELGAATAIDDVDGAVDATPDRTGPFPLGEHVITWRATDSAGQTGEATQTVTVVDTTPPSLTVPGDIEQAGNAPSYVPLGTAGATDIFEPVTLTNDAPAQFPLGTTMVTWTATDANGNAARATQRVTISPSATLSVRIDSPADGAVRDTDDVLVQGPVTGTGPGSAVTVNGLPATIYDATGGGKLFLVRVPLGPGENRITARITDTAWDTHTDTITVTRAGESDVLVTADPTEGIAPLEVEFNVIDRLGDGLQRIEVDVDGDGTPEFVAGQGDLPLLGTFELPGSYLIAFEVTDVFGTTTTHHVPIHVLDSGEIDDQLTELWNRMNEALRAGDVQGALEPLSITARERYERVFRQLLPHFGTILDSYTSWQPVRIASGIAEYAVNRTIDGRNHIFFVYFLKDGLGVWRIESM